MSTANRNPAQQAAADQLAATLERMALALRLGKVKPWCVSTIAPSIAMCAHVAIGQRGQHCNVTELAPWAKPGTGADDALHLIEIGSLRKG